MGQQKQRNRRWVLASRPHGAPVPENFRLKDKMMLPHRVKDRCYCAQFICPWTRICVDV